MMSSPLLPCRHVFRATTPHPVHFHLKRQRPHHYPPQQNPATPNNPTNTPDNPPPRPLPWQPTRTKARSRRSPTRQTSTPTSPRRTSPPCARTAGRTASRRRMRFRRARCPRTRRCTTWSRRRCRRRGTMVLLRALADARGTPDARVARDPAAVLELGVDADQPRARAPPAQQVPTPLVP